ncbi:hypothetical protein FA95DRAFT_1608771 [Auriscalpium vulgare]|uniref:Uncharacterized protein n=1 Tax=Auriscalpium vulgare TaxID=40419 RepID=A0ACB8RKA2_9AGAM|nr:hypothetical protein FA95DRAFT_1608771 [Auriscalpium vulgare]
MSLRSQILQASFPLIKQHGFTRDALSRAVLSLPEPRTEPLPEPAVSALFGEGDTARRVLIDAWLDEGRARMRTGEGTTVAEALKGRLRYNEPVLGYLSEAFALLASPRSGIPPLDVRPAILHAGGVADEACYAAGIDTIGPSWYTKRATLAAIYTAAELHQIGSPGTADEFLDSLLDSASSLRGVCSDSQLFAMYVVKSWASLIKSSGAFL